MDLLFLCSWFMGNECLSDLIWTWVAAYSKTWDLIWCPVNPRKCSAFVKRKEEPTTYVRMVRNCSSLGLPKKILLFSGPMISFSTGALNILQTVLVGYTSAHLPYAQAQQHVGGVKSSKNYGQSRWGLVFITMDRLTLRQSSYRPVI